jgi:hypothetical protein
MARGWESKSVEDQQAEAVADRARPKIRLTAQQAAHCHEMESLELSRRRVQQQLRAVSNARHREMLQNALADLNRRLADLKLEI